ncbi:MAG: hypothetical protein FJ037_03055 [Chloroflexi bacterium]|nr:hypothetical protein [Chloroflexota bacterium]
MLRNVVGVETGLIGLRHQLQALLVLLREVDIQASLDVVEDAELHRAPPKQPHFPADRTFAFSACLCPP